MEVHSNNLGFHKRWLQLDRPEFDDTCHICQVNRLNRKNFYLIESSKEFKEEQQQHSHKNCPVRRKHKSRIDPKTTKYHSSILQKLFHNNYRDNLNSNNSINMPPISEKRSPPMIKENAKENIANSKTLCDKLANRVPEILDFRESWLQEIDLYKDQLRAQQLLTQHNHIHTPDGCIRENLPIKDGIKNTTESTKRRLRARSDSESNDVNKFRLVKDNDEHDLVLKRAREDNFTSTCNNSSYNQQYHHHKYNTTVAMPTTTTAATTTATVHQNNNNNNNNIVSNGKISSLNTATKVIVNPYHATSLLNSQTDKTKYISSGLNPTSIPNNINNSNNFNNNNNSNNINNVNNLSAHSNGLDHKSPKKQYVQIENLKNDKNTNEYDNILPMPVIKPELVATILDSGNKIQQQNECLKTVNESKLDTKQNITTEIPVSVTNENISEESGNKSENECSDLEDDDEDFGDIDEEDVNYSDSEDEYKGDIYLIDTGEELEKSQSPNDSYFTPSSIFTPSLFPHVPPYLTFASHTEKGPTIPNELQKILKWKLTAVMPKIVRRIITNSGCRLIKKTNEWIGTWEKHMKSNCFKTLRSYQKFNHLPGTFKIGRKDSVWRNLRSYMAKYSKREFGFMQKTYIIPLELQMLKKAWPRFAQQNAKWIIKPPASARGTGIKVISRWSQIPKTKPIIVQRYIERPLLIQGSKFDLRLYVVVTSINPLRIYMYPDGLARFASVQYSDKLETLNDRCMHLTNYSINKLSANYAKNEDINACQGHKWTLKSLWTYFQQRGINTKYLWGTLRNLVIRTMISGEGPLNKLFRMNINSRYNCYELFGFDVLLDEDLTPWLLEVNISPSLHSELPLDLHVKGPLVQAVLNTALYQVPPKLSAEQEQNILSEYGLKGPLCYDKRLYVTHLSDEETKKHNYYTSKTIDCREEYLETILDNLTPDDLRCLITSEDELARSSPLERIFPGPNSYKFLDYIDSPRYYNRLLDAWEYCYYDNRELGIKCLQELCELKVHLQVTPTPVNKESCEREIVENNEDNISISGKNSLEDLRCNSVDDIPKEIQQQQQQKQPQEIQQQPQIQLNHDTTIQSQSCSKQSQSTGTPQMQINGGGPRPIAVEIK